MKSVFPIIAGSNQPLEVVLSDVLTDTVQDLTGCTGWSATAKETSTGDLVAFSYVAPVLPATDGKVKLEWNTTDFDTVGLYSVQITCSDATGHTLIMPSEEGQLLIKVGAQNT